MIIKAFMSLLISGNTFIANRIKCHKLIDFQVLAYLIYIYVTVGCSHLSVVLKNKWLLAYRGKISWMWGGRMFCCIHLLGMPLCYLENKAHRATIPFLLNSHFRTDYDIKSRMSKLSQFGFCRMFSGREFWCRQLFIGWRLSKIHCNDSHEHLVLNLQSLGQILVGNHDDTCLCDKLQCVICMVKNK